MVRIRTSRLLQAILLIVSEHWQPLERGAVKSAHISQMLPTLPQLRLRWKLFIVPYFEGPQLLRSFTLQWAKLNKEWWILSIVFQVPSRETEFRAAGFKYQLYFPIYQCKFSTFYSIHRPLALTYKTYNRSVHASVLYYCPCDHVISAVSRLSDTWVTSNHSVLSVSYIFFSYSREALVDWTLQIRKLQSRL